MIACEPPVQTETSDPAMNGETVTWWRFECTVEVLECSKATILGGPPSGGFPP